MKKVLMMGVVLIATVFVSKAQVFIGGGVGFDYCEEKTKNGSNSFDKLSETAFVFSPKIGFYLNDKFAIGLEVDIINLSKKTTEEFRLLYIFGYNGGYYSHYDLKENVFAWGLSAFARYHLWGTGKFSLHLESPLGIVGTSTTATITIMESSISIGNPELSFGIAVFPVLSYGLTDKFRMEINSDFLRLGFTSTITEDRNNSSNKDVTNNFGFGVNSSSYFNRIPVTISCILKF